MQSAKLLFRRLYFVNLNFSQPQLYPLFSITSITSFASWKTKEKEKCKLHQCFQSKSKKLKWWNVFHSKHLRRKCLCNILAQLVFKLCLFVSPENCSLHGLCPCGHQPCSSSGRKQKFEVLDKKFTLGIVAAQASTNWPRGNLKQHFIPIFWRFFLSPPKK